MIALTQIPRLKAERMRHAIAGLVLLFTAYGVWTNFAFAIVQQRFYAYPNPQEKRLVFRDFTDAVSAGGLGAIPAFGMQWRKYVEATAFVSGNVGVNRSTGRDDEPVIASQAVPARADYTVALPTAGRYSVDVRCASAEPRPPSCYSTDAWRRWSAALTRWVHAAATALVCGRVFPCRAA